jgi:outer membrane lipoprotein SlyB
MKTNLLRVLVALFTISAGGCYATTTTSTTWTADPSIDRPYARYGRVELVREIVRRREGNPVGGALLGAAIGAAIGGDGPAGLVGAVGGAGIGVAASQGSTETRDYEIHVAFDDGGRQVFVYADYAPFRPGQPVVATAHGIQAL